MNIERLHIDGFGVWNDRTLGPLSPGVNIFHGPNETGKTTLMTFIRAILFGFDRRGSPRRYEPLNGGGHGGWLDLTVQGRPIRVERKSSRHVRGAVVTYDGESTGGEKELDDLLCGTTRTLYHNVFAFGLEELEQFHTLQDNEIAQVISGATLGIGASRWAGVQRDLETRQSALFLPRGQTSTINVALRELENVRDDLDRTEHQPEDYWAAHEMRTRLQAETAGLEEIVKDLKQRAAVYEKRLKARPLWERRKELEFRLAALPMVDTFPDGGVERLELLRSQGRAIQTQHDEVRRENDRRRARRLELRTAADPAEYTRRNQIIDALRNLLPRIDAARRVYASAVERHHAIAQENAAIGSAIQTMRPPSLVAFLAFIGLIWTGAGGLVWADQLYVAAGVLAVSLVAMLWQRKRLLAFANLERQAQACSERLEACERELKSLEKEGRHIETEIRRLTGKTEISSEDIDTRVADLQEFSKLVDDLRKLDQEVERGDGEMARIKRGLDERRTEIAALLAEASAPSEQEFLERAQIYKERQQLLIEVGRLPAEPPETGLLFDTRINEEEAYEAVRSELAAAEHRLAEARHESGRVEERIVTMERSEERARALARQETILSKIDTDAEQWAIVTLCRALLDETRKVYETDRQPNVLREASVFFQLMTASRYQRVVAPLDGTDIQVERFDGTRLSPQLLSRGTAEQLYLAMRLALVRDYAQRMDPLPVVFDDIFVNFDPDRTRNTLSAVAELAETHQVLLFTCHPHLVNLVEEIVPATRVFPLQS